MLRVFGFRPWDNADCAREEYDSTLDAEDPGLPLKLSFDPAADITAPYINVAAQPKVAVLREQGVNGQVEMAAAFHKSRFDAFDVHMTDLLSGRSDLAQFDLLVACGGFSYGDVLGAGGGWAKSVLFNDGLRRQFQDFFHSKLRQLERDIAAGKVVIVTDDEDRENEGDLVAAASKITPEAVNFMAVHGRGLICTPVTEERAAENAFSTASENLLETSFSLVKACNVRTEEIDSEA